jgi:hypothetical protein
VTDRFSAHVTFETGVTWAPSDYKPLSEEAHAAYVAYAEKEADKVRKIQEDLEAK